VIVACKIADHPLSIAQKIVILYYGTMIEDKLNPFDLNRTEYASLLGISPNAVRMRLRHGKLEGEYIFKNGKYFFRAPKRVRENQGLDHPTMTTQKKRKINRGNHHKANYPNEAFRKHNEMKMLAKLKHRVDPEVQDLLPEAVEIAKQKKAERMQSTINDTPTKNYGTGLFNESNKGYGDPQYHNGKAHNYHPNKFEPTNRGRVITKKYYY
jgi:hypothetical protein